MYFKPTVVLNLSYLTDNLCYLKKKIGSLPIMLMVKADAYGHGLIEVSKKLESKVDFLGVARLCEAIELIESGITRKIVLMEGFFDIYEYKYCVINSLDFVIHQSWQVDIVLNNVVLTSESNIWIKVNSGMNRLGFSLEEVSDIYNRLVSAGINNLKFITHFSHADCNDSSITIEQFNDFYKLIHKITDEPFFSISNSASIINHKFTHQGIIRAGIAIYGLNPIFEHELKFKPVMSFYSKIIAINECPAESKVGYSGTWISSMDTRLAVIAVGYGDGYPRHAKNGTPIFIRNKSYPLVGRVSMDMIMVDIGFDDISVGDTVELWGNNISINDVATASDTISYELLCGITKRVNRIYLHESQGEIANVF